MIHRVGVSGWSYRSWHGDYYPPGLRQRDELTFLASRLSTAEINASFYRLQRPSTYQRWYDTVGPEFRFAVKGGRYLTHLRRLREPHEALANFFASGVLALRERLGPLLWQLPADFDVRSPVLPDFLQALPRTHGEARELAVRHGAAVAAPERHWLGDPQYDALELRHAVEVRSAEGGEELVALLAHHRVALVASDGAGHWPLITEITAPFAYVRLHGPHELYHGGYDAEQLRQWAEVIHSWQRDTWVYFDNDADGRAPHDAERLAALLSAESGCRGPARV